MPTIEQLIDRQRGVVAEEDRRLAQRGIDPTATPIQIDAAKIAASAQHDHLAELLARKVARDQAVAEHEVAEQAHADDLAVLDRELEGARRQLADTVSTAIEGLDAVWRASAEYDRLLAARAAWLRSVGLPARFKERSDDEVRFSTGGFDSTAFDAPHLVLGGRRWMAVGPYPVLQYALGAVVAGHQLVHETRSSSLHELLDPVTRRPAPVQA